MNRIVLISAMLVALMPIAPTALALGDGTYMLRRQADSEFRIAQKAYRSAREKYGDSLDAMPADERESACRKVGWALHDNRIRYSTEDMISQMQYKRQVEALETYASGLGCPD
ncbi:hypothetical protein [Pseudodesulfovibrio pelocollis]|uniref:hypothetical protein n=1 Tax=Pseudodesulfovibrio pelocollis TaxID=3051432 RepID=UPI00255A8922|nr:hypothetical protein [Pseudodesulfovibrio sp. SB368]